LVRIQEGGLEEKIITLTGDDFSVIVKRKIVMRHTHSDPHPHTLTSGNMFFIIIGIVIFAVGILYLFRTDPPKESEIITSLKPWAYNKDDMHSIDVMVYMPTIRDSSLQSFQWDKKSVITLGDTLLLGQFIHPKERWGGDFTKWELLPTLQDAAGKEGKLLQLFKCSVKEISKIKHPDDRSR
jgi:hypothetical protein